MLYILDEPSIGLHQRDNRRLLDTLIAMRDLGNTVIVVEHDEETIRAADYVVDLGPGAGELGGRGRRGGHAGEIERYPESLTGRIPLGRARRSRSPAAPAGQREGDRRCAAPREHNLKDVDVAFPAGRLDRVTGVSGSGKSTLVNDILHRALARGSARRRGRAGRARDDRGPRARRQGDRHRPVADRPDAALESRRPTSALHTRSASCSRVPGGADARLQAGAVLVQRQGRALRGVRGRRQIKIEMHFLPDVYVTCDVCAGRRYNRETLEILYKGNIAEVLDMTVAAGARVLRARPADRETAADRSTTSASATSELGQPATTLSGGEAQRIKLAEELSRRATGRTLYLLDEPTTGLHFDDIKKLLGVLQRLVDQGNTVIVIEHNLDVIKTADWIIDLGPEGGDGGGRIVAEGTPEQVAGVKSSHTGQFLRRSLASARQRARA